MNMKKIFMAALAAMTLLAGCAKENTPVVENQDIKVNFTVAEKPGFGADTKAVKTEWASGDQIAIFCQPGATGNYIIDNAKIIYLQYDGTSWSASHITSELATVLTASGNFTAVHYRVAGTDNISLNNQATFETYYGGEIFIYQGTYSVVDETISLGEIAMNIETNSAYAAGQQFQVSVKGLVATGGWKMAIANNTYTPSVNNVASYDELAHTGTYAGLWRLVSDSGKIGTWGGDLSDESNCACVQNGDDISFVFIYDNDLSDEEKYKKYHFHLTNGTDVYTYTVDRGVFADEKYQTNLEIRKAYILPAITDSKWVKQ